MSIICHRVYSSAPIPPGYRILVDGVWPRGIRRETLALDAWRKDLAPSKELRQWFGHDPAKWSEFHQRYMEELARKTSQLEELLQLCSSCDLILLFGAKDENHNQAIVLKEMLERMSAGSKAD